MAIPILRADDLRGIITLQHSEPGHYTIAKFMEVTAKQIALILENARLLYVKYPNNRLAWSISLSYQRSQGYRANP